MTYYPVFGLTNDVKKLKTKSSKKNISNILSTSSTVPLLFAVEFVSEADINRDEDAIINCKKNDE